MSELCPCNSQLLFYDCCEPYLSGQQSAPTPLALMRSRYTAFVFKNAQYLLNTWHPNKHDDNSLDAISQSFADTDWLGLTIIDSVCDEQKNEGYVEFIARFLNRATQQTHAIHERSYFIKTANKWLYLSGVTPQIGRNDKCLCGSGKKYKKCCG